MKNTNDEILTYIETHYDPEELLSVLFQDTTLDYADLLDLLEEYIMEIRESWEEEM